MICIICGEPVTQPCDSPDFLTDELNAHQECWDDYRQWIATYEINKAPSSSPVRTSASHAENGGSNPPGVTHVR